MRVSITLALLVWAVPAHADWQYTKWGMTPEQVIEASKNTVSRIPEDQQKNQSRSSFVGKLHGSYDTGDFRFEVDFQFSKQNKLEMIALTPTEPDRCERLQSALLSQYGSPWENRSDRYGPYFIWLDRAHRNTVKFSNVPPVPNVTSVRFCLLLYERLEITGL